MSESLPTQTADQGHGPLWQRDYWAAVRESTLSPEEIVQLLRERFPEFSPEKLAAFSNDKSTPLGVGDEMKVFIQGYGECAVRVVHLEPRSLTLRTLEGHFEAGRITFGAYYDGESLIFRVRSRARSVDRLRHAGYKLLGQKMQGQTWITFIERVVEKTGGAMIGKIHVRTRELRSTLADLGELDTPTFSIKDR